MIESKKIYELVNNHFQNPFQEFEPKIKPPFILLEEGEELEKEHSNLMINFHLFILKLKFTPNTIYRKGVIHVDVVMQSDYSEIQIVTDETAVKKFIINYIPAVVFRFHCFKRSDIKSETSPEFLIKDPATNYLVDLANFEVIDIYDKVSFKTFSNKEMTNFKNMLKKHEEQFKHLFFDPSHYPRYDKEKGIIFPSKEVFNWEIIKPEEFNGNDIPTDITNV